MSKKDKLLIGVCKGIILGVGAYSVWAYGKVCRMTGYSDAIQDCTNAVNEVFAETATKIMSEEN